MKTTSLNSSIGRMLKGIFLGGVLFAMMGFGLLLSNTAVAATFTVNSTGDTADASVGNGVCADASGYCTIRAAIAEANAITGTDTINIPAGTYSAASTLPAITTNMIISGASRDTTFVTGTNSYLFNFSTGVTNTTILQNLTIKSTYNPIYLQNGASPIIQNNYIVNTGSATYGIYVYPSGSYSAVKIYNNVITGFASSSSAKGIYITIPGGSGCSATNQDNCIVIKNNVISRCMTGMNVYGNSYIYNNMIVGNYGSSVAPVYLNESPSYNNPHYFFNNTIYGNVATGGYTSTYVLTNTRPADRMYNNIIMNNRARAIYCYSDYSYYVERASVHYGNADDTYYGSNCSMVEYTYETMPVFAKTVGPLTTVGTPSAQTDGTYRITFTTSPLVVDAHKGQFLVWDGSASPASCSGGTCPAVYYIVDNLTNSVDVRVYNSSDASTYVPTGRSVYLTQFKLDSSDTAAIDLGADYALVYGYTQQNTDYYIDLDSVWTTDYYGNARKVDQAGKGDGSYDIDIGATEHASANTAPSISISSVAQRTDGTGHATISFTVTDAESDSATWVDADTEYSISPYSEWTDITFDTADGSHTADEPMSITSGEGSFVAVIDASGWTSGTYEVRLKVNDGTDNSSQVTSSSFVVDNIDPSTPPAPDLYPGDDTGSSETDNITKNTTGLTFTGTAEANSTVQLYDGDDPIGSSTTASEVGAYSVDLDLSAGEHLIKAKVTDAMGNASEKSAGLSVTVDTSEPSAPGSPDLAVEDDTGSSSTDNLTKNTTGLTIGGSCESSATVELFDSAESKGTVACSSGEFTKDLDLAAGVHSITAYQTDAAGNDSGVSETLTITIDATAPTVSSVTSDKTESGVLKIGDTITFTVAPSIADAELTVSPTSYNSGALSWSTLDEGANYTATYTVVDGQPDQAFTPLQLESVRLTDTAGNISSPLSGEDVGKTIDANKPIMSAMAFDPDSGTAKIGDSIILLMNADQAGYTAHAITINGESGESIVFDDNEDGTYDATYTVESGDTDRTAGTIPVSIVFEDSAGNTSIEYTSVNENTLAIDAAAPTNQDTVFTPSATKASGAEVTIVSSGDETNEIWFAPAGTVTFVAGSQMTTAASGTATTILAPTVAGTYKLYVIDAAGNASSASTATLTVLGNRYVSTTGSDGTGCSSSECGDNTCALSGSPCATIVCAISCSTSGDTISIAAGTYNTDAIINIDGKNLTVTGAGITGANTTLVKQTANDNLFNISGATIDSSTVIKNLVIEAYPGKYAITLNETAAPTIEKNIILVSPDTSVRGIDGYNGGRPAAKTIIRNNIVVGAYNGIVGSANTNVFNNTVVNSIYTGFGYGNRVNNIAYASASLNTNAGGFYNCNATYPASYNAAGRNMINYSTSSPCATQYDHNLGDGLDNSGNPSLADSNADPRFVVVDKGVSTAISSSGDATLTDSSKNWDVNSLVGKFITPNVNYSPYPIYYFIKSNTNTVITVEPVYSSYMSTYGSEGSVYEITSFQPGSNSPVTGTASAASMPEDDIFGNARTTNYDMGAVLSATGGTHAARTLYVATAPTGSDSTSEPTPCSEASPCATLPYALAWAYDGDTIHLKAGEHTVSAAVDPGTRNISIVGDGVRGSSLTSIRQTSTATFVFRYSMPGINSNSVIKNLVIECNATSGQHVSGIYMRSTSASPLIERNVFINPTGGITYPIKAEANTGTPTIRNNIMLGGYYGIFGATNVAVINNTVVNATAIAYNRGDRTNNIAYANAVGFSTCDDTYTNSYSDAYLNTTNYSSCTGNTLNTQDPGFVIDKSGTSTSLTATTLYDSTAHWTTNQWVGYFVTPNKDRAGYPLYFLITGNDENTLTVYNSGAYTMASGNNPVAGVSGNTYNITSFTPGTSSAGYVVDAGTETGAPSDDIYGGTRPIDYGVEGPSGLTTDIGAVEFDRPIVTNVTSDKADGAYKVDEVIDIKVTFNKAVTVTGTPQITLETGGTDRAVNYSSGSGGATLTFNYTVQAGDTSLDLDYVGIDSLALNNGMIRDSLGNDAVLTLPPPETPGSLGANKAIVIDATAPTVTNVTSLTSNGSYGEDDEIDIQVVFDEPVDVTGSPKLTLETGDTDRDATYLSGTGTNTLVFRYTVQAGDTIADLDYAGTDALALHDGTIKDTAGNAATLTLAEPGTAGSLGNSTAISIDTTAPSAPSTPALAAADDTGDSDSDHITNQTTGLTFTGTAEADASVQLYNGTTPIGDPVVATGGDWTVNVDLPAGEYTINAKATDDAGNTSTASSDLSVTVDTTPPTADTTGEPTGTSNVTALDVTVTGTGVTHYKSKVGLSASTVCSSEADYSAETDVATKITTSLAAIDDGEMRLCVVGKDAAGNWQTYADASSVTWDKQTNSAPTLTTISTLTGESEDHATTISYATLLAASNAADTDEDAISFRVEAVSTGTLTKDGSPVVPESTLLSTGESLVWTPANNANGAELNAFTVKVWDGTVASTSPVQVKVSVTAVNDAPTVSAIGIDAAEDVVGRTAAIGSDIEDDELTYSIVTPATHGTCAVDGSDITYTPEDNYYGSDSCTYRAHDGTEYGEPALVSISVTAGNDTPTNISLSASTVDENEPIGTVVGALSTTDFDPEDTHTYSLVAGTGDTDNGSFAIDGSNLETNAIFDHETKSSYSVRIRTTDLGLAFYEKSFTITINDVNEAPVFTTASGALTEATEAVSYSSAVNATDPESDTITYTISAGALPSGLSLNSSTGAITGTPAELLATTNYEFTVQASDAEFDTTRDFSINVVAGNDGPTATAQSPTAGDEDTAQHLTLTGSDPEDQDLTFSTTDCTAPAHGALSALNADTGTITYTPEENYNGADSFGFKVSDGTTTSACGTVSLTITSVNDLPTSENARISTTEDSPHIFAISDFPFSDIDIGDALNEIQITSLPTHGTLRLSDVDVTQEQIDGVFHIAAYQLGSLSYVPAANEYGDSYATFGFKVHDALAFSETAYTMTVDVTSGNDTPTNITLSSSSVNENQPTGTEVGTLSSTDGDSGETFTYTLVSGEGSDDNSSFTIDDNVLKTADTFDFEDKSSYSIRIRTTDSDDLYFEKQFNITVANVNETPTNITLSTSSINEGSAIESTVGTFSTSDPDSADTFTYTLVSGVGATDNASFTIDGDALKTNTALDFETKPSYSIRVRSKDAGNLTYSKAFTINVTDQNEAPTFTTAAGQIAEMTEGVAGSTAIVATDTDTGAVLTYTVISGALPSGLSLNPSTGAITGTPAELLETTSYDFTVQVSDGENSIDRAFSINIVGNNDTPTATPQSVNVDEDSSLPITLAGTDPEDQPLTFVTTGCTEPSHGALSLLNEDTGSITYTPAENFNGPDSFGFKVSDGTNTSACATVSVTVGGVDDAPYVTDVDYTGDMQVGTTQTAVYTFHDNDAGDTDTGTTFKWLWAPLSDGSYSEISGATSSTYLVTDTYAHKYIKVEVTPKNALTGTPVRSEAHLIVDSAPVLAHIGNKNGNENTPLTFTIAATDADHDTITYSATGLPTGSTLDEDSGEFSWTPSYSQSGDHVVTFKATANSVEATEEITISISNTNRAPVANEQTVSTAEDTAKAITLSGSDADENTITYDVGTPAHGELSGTAPSLTYTPSENYNGTDSFTFTVNDGTTDSDPATVTINVTPENDPPVANAQSVTLDEDNSAPITLSGSDPDGNALDYIIVTPPVKGHLEAGTPPLYTYTPNLNASGSDSFTFRVNDGTANSAPATVSITINAIDDAPIMGTIGPRTVAEGNLLSFTATATDAESGSLTWNCTNNNDAATTANICQYFNLISHSFSWTPDYDKAGVYSILIGVEDASELSDSEAVTITVSNSNRAPVLASIGGRSINEGAQLLITLSAVDPDGDAITYDASPLPEGSTMIGNTFTWTPTFLQGGGYDVTFSATANGQVDFESVHITVNAVDRAPALVEIDNKSVNENANLSFDVLATDPDGDAITYGILNKPTGATFDPDSHNFSWTPGFNQAGVYNVTFTAVSGTPLMTDSKLVTITVGNVNRAPIITPLAPFLPATENVPFQTNIIASDPDGNEISMAFAPAGEQGSWMGTIDCHPLAGATITKIGPTTFRLNWSPDFDQAGIRCTTIKVTDDAAEPNSTLATITFDVDNNVRPPTITPVPLQIADEGDTVTFDVSVSNPDAATLTVSMESTSGFVGYLALPPAAQFDPATRRFTWVTTYADNGSYIAIINAENENPINSHAEAVPVIFNIHNTDRPPVLTIERTDPVANGSGIICQKLLNNVMVSIRATDPDVGDTLTYTMSGAPTGAGLARGTNSNRVFTWAPNEIGKSVITFKATDTGALFDSKTITVVGVKTLDQCATAVAAVQEGGDPLEALQQEEVESGNSTPTGVPIAKACFSDPKNAGGICITTRNVRNGAVVALNGASSYQPALTELGAATTSSTDLIYHWKQAGTGGCPSVELSDNDSQSASAPTFTAPEAPNDSMLRCNFDLTVENSFGISVQADRATVVVIENKKDTDSTQIPFGVISQTEDGVVVRELDLLDENLSVENDVNADEAVTDYTLLTIVDTNGFITSLSDYEDVDKITSIKVPQHMVRTFDVTMTIADSDDGEEYIFGLPKYNNSRGAVFKMSRAGLLDYSAQGNGEVLVDLLGDEVPTDKLVGSEDGELLGAGLKVVGDYSGDGVPDLVFKRYDASTQSAWFVGYDGGSRGGQTIVMNNDSYRFKIGGEGMDIANSTISTTKTAVTNDDFELAQGPMINIFILGQNTMAVDLQKDIIDSGESTFNNDNLFDQLLIAGRAIGAGGFHNLQPININNPPQQQGGGENPINFCPPGYVPPPGFVNNACQQQQQSPANNSVSGKLASTPQNSETELLENIDIPDSTNVASGDINHDGFTDTIVGDPEVGKIYAYYGSASFTGAKATTEADILISCPHLNDECGRIIVTGDLSGDGYDDIMIGAPAADGQDDNIADAGEVYIIYGDPALPSSIDISTYDSETIIYGSTENGYLGLEMAVIDSDGNGVKELACNLQSGGAIIISFDTLQELGRTLRVDQLDLDTLEFTNPDKVVMMNIKLSASVDEDVKVTGFTITTTGTGVDNTDVKTVEIYEDTNGNGQLDSSDTLLTSDATFDTDDGTLTFSNMDATITKGETVHWLIVYDFESSGNNASVSAQMSITEGEQMTMFTIPIMLMGIALLIIVLRRSRRVAFTLLIVAFASMYLTSCGDDPSTFRHGTNESIDGTYTYKASVAQTTHINAIGKDSGGAVEILGAPVAGPEITVTFSQQASTNQGASLSDNTGGGGCGLKKGN